MKELTVHTAGGRRLSLTKADPSVPLHCFNHKHTLLLPEIKNSTGLPSFLMFLIPGMRGSPQSQRTLTWAILPILHKLSHKSKVRDSNFRNACRGIFKEKLTNDIVDALDSKKSLVPFGEF